MTSNRAPSITAEDINSLAVAFAYDTRAPINSVDIRADGLIVATSFANGIHFHRISDDLPALHIVTVRCIKYNFEILMNVLIYLDWELRWQRYCAVSSKRS